MNQVQIKKTPIIPFHKQFLGDNSFINCNSFLTREGGRTGGGEVGNKRRRRRQPPQVLPRTTPALYTAAAHTMKKAQGLEAFILSHRQLLILLRPFLHYLSAQPRRPNTAHGINPTGVILHESYLLPTLYCFTGLMTMHTHMSVLHFNLRMSDVGEIHSFILQKLPRLTQIPNTNLVYILT